MRTALQYTAQAGKLLRQLDWATKPNGPLLASRVADGLADEIVRETRQKFERLLPAMPYIPATQEHRPNR